MMNLMMNCRLKISALLNDRMTWGFPLSWICTIVGMEDEGQGKRPSASAPSSSRCTTAVSEPDTYSECNNLPRRVECTQSSSRRCLRFEMSLRCISYLVIIRNKNDPNGPNLSIVLCWVVGCTSLYMYIYLWIKCGSLPPYPTERIVYSLMTNSSV